MEMRIVKMDDNIFTTMSDTDKVAYFANDTAYSNLPWKEKGDPSHGWAVPFVTGHKYKIHWG